MPVQKIYEETLISWTKTEAKKSLYLQVCYGPVHFTELYSVYIVVRRVVQNYISYMKVRKYLPALIATGYYSLTSLSSS